MNNMIKNEIEKINLPAELSERSKLGIRKAKEEQGSTRKDYGKKIRFIGGLVASLLLIMILLDTSGILNGKEVSFSVPLSRQNSDMEKAAVVDDSEDTYLDLPVIGSKKTLEKLIGMNKKKNSVYFFSAPASEERMIMESAQDEAVDNSGKGLGLGGGSSYYSQTNVQVQGVDESDIVKTDGKYIYQVNWEEVVVSRVYPVEEMKVVSKIKMEQDFYPMEMYVDSRYMVVIGSGSKFLDIYPEGDWGQSSDIMIYPPRSGVIKAVVFDITNKNNIRKIREIEVEGNYLSSRKIGSNVYLVTNKWLYDAIIYENPGVVYRDTAEGEQLKEVGLDKIKYFPDVEHQNFLIVTAFDLDNGKQGSSIEAFLGSGINVYMSLNNLYVAAAGWSDGSSWDSRWNNSSGMYTTTIYKFGVNGTEVGCKGRGEVPGNILNQFSMDEYGGYFRIATTSPEGQSSNNVYILDGKMEVVGRLENLAPGEQIFSARFMGEKCYLVTFEMMDPLFVIDLGIPQNPKVLGELKIPGFSNYLHPLDDNHLLGIGRDTKIKVMHGREVVEELGIKLAIFDVTDVNNPVEKHVKVLGGLGTYSEVLHNHKALMYKDGLMALPVNLMEYHPQSGSGIMEFTFQGVYVTRVDIETGFTFLGDVTHKEDIEQPYRWGYDDSSFIKRAVLINNLLYTVSDNYIKANLLDGMAEAGILDLR